MTETASSSNDVCEKVSAQKNVEVFGLQLHNPVFFLAATMVLLLAGLILAAPDRSCAMLGSMRTHTVQSFDWLLAALTLSEVTSVIAIGLLVIFIITSADSGALVVDTITCGGHAESPVAQRVFWACMSGVTASALLYGGGTSTLESLQAGTIAAALPFTIVLPICCWSLFLGMRNEMRTQQEQPR